MSLLLPLSLHKSSRLDANSVSVSVSVFSPNQSAIPAGSAEAIVRVLRTSRFVWANIRSLFARSFVPLSKVLSQKASLR